ncbi:MAG: hypothetical protein A2Y65_05950 [Deltaproteobacteria bacterium RBG_13_52_11]|nr:MAG: hypothetical protein A2Y65_05950 [Deltaproteobacteria bacterium RBG_13_52_11]
MDLKELRKELSELKEEMKELREGLVRLEQEMLGREEELHRAIKARGMQVHRRDPGDDLIFPSEASPEERTSLYQLLRHYSFRLFLRDVISTKDAFRAEGLVRYCSLEIAQQYISSLCELKLAEAIGKGTSRLLNRSLSSFGPTLEWFVAQMFQREFASPAIYGVRFKETHSGGDYDVIALWEGWIVYVEIKSSPPRGIERGEIGSFLARATDLLPDIAFLFNDTQLRMKDKVVLMFEEELYERYGTSSDRFPVQRLVDELFHINHRIYIVNSKRDVVTNFNLCLRDFLFHQRADLFPILPPPRRLK